MKCTCQQSVREEREAIARWLEERGQRWAAIRIRMGEHIRSPGWPAADSGLDQPSGE
jgi:hypothetical protein